MAKLQLGLDVDDKNLVKIVQKKHRVYMEVVPQQTAGSIIAKEKVTAEARSAGDSFSKRLKDTLKAISDAYHSELSRQIVGGFKISAGIIAGTIATALVGGVTFLARGLQSSFEKGIPIAGTFRSLFTNMPSELFQKQGKIIKGLFDKSKEYGVSIEEMAKALEAVLPTMRTRTVENINVYADAFAKLKYLENITAEQFQEIGNIATLTRRPVEQIAQMFNVFTDNIGHTGGQISRELRKLTDNFGSNIETMFATLEYVSKNITLDPREAVAFIQKGMEDLSKYIAGQIPFEKLSADAMKLSDIFQAPEFGEILQKYTTKLGDITSSFAELMSTEPAKIEQFFAKKREEIKSEMYSLMTTNMPAVEKIYGDINRMVKANFGEWSPVVKSIFISPETGAPTFATALLPIIEKLTGTNNILERIEGLIKSLIESTNKQQYGTNWEWWQHWLGLDKSQLKSNSNLYIPLTMGMP